MFANFLAIGIDANLRFVDALGFAGDGILVEVFLRIQDKEAVGQLILKILGQLRPAARVVLL